MSQQSKTTLQSAINTQIADNTSGDISAADIRDNLINITDSLLFNTGSQGITGSLTITEGVTLVSASTSQTVGEGAINLQSTSSTVIPSIILSTSNGLKWIKIGHSGGYNTLSSAGDTWIYGSTSLNLESNNDVNVWSRLNATQGIIITGSLNSTGSVSLGVPNMFGNRNLDIAFNNGIESIILAAGVNGSRTNGIDMSGQTGTTNLRAESVLYLLSPITNIISPTTNITGSLTVTGSQNITGSLTVTGGITSSLLGTASYATQALSASWAPSVASNPFPFTGSAIVSGSMIITGGLQVSTSIDSVNRHLLTSNIPVLQWGSTDLKLVDVNNNTSVMWGARNFFDENGLTSIDWNAATSFAPRTLLDNSEIASVKWNSRQLVYSSGNTALNWGTVNKISMSGSAIVSGSLEVTGSLTVTGSTSLNGLMTLQPLNPLPSVTNGSIAYSSSGDFYFGSGSAWRKLTL